MVTPTRPRKEEVEMDLDELERITQYLVQHSLGYNEADSILITRVLLYAQVRGNSQGVIKILTGGVPAHCREATPIEVEHETKLSARLHGHGAAGMLVLQQATALATAKAKAHGLSIVATHGTASGTGAIGFFVRAIAEAGLIGIVLSQSPELVCPHGSYEPLFGTNPFAIGVPRRTETDDRKRQENEEKEEEEVPPPLVLDMATSAYAWYALKEAKAAGQAIPEDVAFDAHGQPTRDPSAALAGALRVFDRSYKGSHIALMVEILGGALAGGDVEDKWQRENWGNSVLAIDPEVLGQPLAAFTAKVEALVARVKAAKPVPLTAEEMQAGKTAASGPCLPGEQSEAKAASVLQRGRIRLERSVYEGLMKAERENRRGL